MKKIWYWPYAVGHRRAHLLDGDKSLCGKVTDLKFYHLMQAHESHDNPFNVASCAACLKKAKK